MMVNIGGLPRSADCWHRARLELGLRLYASASWIALDGVMSLLFCKEPPSRAPQRAPCPLSYAHGRVIGNVRFFSACHWHAAAPGHGQQVVDLPQGRNRRGGVVAVSSCGTSRAALPPAPPQRAFYLQPLKVGEGRYLLFLLMSLVIRVLDLRKPARDDLPERFRLCGL